MFGWSVLSVWLSVLSVWLSVLSDWVVCTECLVVCTECLVVCTECLGSLCLTGEDDDYQDASSINVILLPIDDTRSHDGDDDDDDYQDAASRPPEQLTSAAMHRKHNHHHHHQQQQHQQQHPQQQHAYHPHDLALDPAGRTTFPPSPREMYSHQMGYSPTTPNGHQVTVTDWYRIQTQKGSNERLFNTDTQYAHFRGNRLYDIITNFVLT